MAEPTPTHLDEAMRSLDDMACADACVPNRIRCFVLCLRTSERQQLSDVRLCRLMHALSAPRISKVKLSRRMN
eukprot:2247283-Rhodomonas_salina.2